MLVVPTLTRHDLLDRMLRSVDHPVGHLVVIDNSGAGIVRCRTGRGSRPLFCRCRATLVWQRRGTLRCGWVTVTVG
jgi:hypothetical protein